MKEPFWRCQMCLSRQPLASGLTLCSVCGSQFYQVKSSQPETFDYLEEDRTAYWQRECRRIRSMMKRDVGSHLDIGAGVGEFLRTMGAFSQWAVESNVPMGRRLQASGITSRMTLKHVHRSFDIVTAYAVIEHMDDAGWVRDRLNSLVNPGGILVVMVPTLRTPMGKLEGNIHNSPPVHVVFPSEWIMDKIAGQHGLELIRRSYETGGTLPRYFRPLLIAQVIGRVWDATWLNRLPIGDHIYSYWRRPGQ